MTKRDIAINELIMKRQLGLRSLILMAFLFSLLNSMLAQQNSTFKIITKGQLVFKEGGVVYRLGIKASEFEKAFGPPESRSKSEGSEGYMGNCWVLHYTTDGLEVLVSPEGRIKSFTFFVIPSGDYKAARVQTDMEIKKGASARQIQKVYGRPYKRKDFTLAEFDWVNLYYKNESLVLDFHFDKGEFETISICSDYLPYLDSLPNSDR